MKGNALGSYLTVQTGVDHFPGLRIHIVAVQFVGQRVICSATKYVEVAVKGNHSVSVASLRRRRGAPQQVFCWDACPPENENQLSVSSETSGKYRTCAES